MSWSCHKPLAGWVLFASTVVCVFATSAKAVVVESQSSNTQVVFEPFGFSIEDPAIGEQYLECAVSEWRDADDGGGPDWASTGTVGGSVSQAWLEHTATLTTTTTVASDAVTFNMEGDSNDGRCRLSVDGSEIAVIDMYDPGHARLVVFVRDLPFGTHTLLIETLGTSTHGGNGSDVATFGGTALDCGTQPPKFVKFSQRPISCECKADIDKSGTVEISDVIAVANCVGGDCSGCDPNSCDVDCDGDVDQDDADAAICVFQNNLGCCPTSEGEDIESNIDWGDSEPNVVVADDFTSDGRPITGVRWWGSVLKEPCDKPAVAGDDCWSTACDGDTFVDFGGGSIPAIPAGFFGPGSDPFSGVVSFGGLTGFIDTVITRLDDMCLSGDLPVDAHTPIQITQLDLRSCSQIIVTFNGGQDPTLFDVVLFLDGAQDIGDMWVTKTNDNGGTFDSVIPVKAGFQFAGPGPGVFNFLPGTVLTLNGFAQPWVQAQPTTAICGLGGGFFPGHDKNEPDCCPEVCHEGPAPGHEHCVTPPKCPKCEPPDTKTCDTPHQGLVCDPLDPNCVCLGRPDGSGNCGSILNGSFLLCLQDAECPPGEKCFIDDAFFIVPDLGFCAENCTPIIIGPDSPTDNCIDKPTVGEGTFSFSNAGANTDGPPPTCALLGSDVWLNYVPTCSGTATIDTCTVGYDSAIEVFDGCNCAPTGPVIACNDDFCGNGLQSLVTFPVIAGQCYKVRIGGFSGDQGAGNVTIACTLSSAGAPGVGPNPLGEAKNSKSLVNLNKKGQPEFTRARFNATTDSLVPQESSLSGPGGLVYASDPQGANLGTVNPVTGAFSIIGPFTGASGNVTEIEWSPDGLTLYAGTGGGTSSLHTIDANTGTVLTTVAHSFGAMQGMEFDTVGNLLATDIISCGLNEVDPATGTFTFIGSIGPFCAIGGLAFDATFTTLYGITSGGAAPPTLLDINPATGFATPIAVVSVLVEMSSLEFLDDGRLVSAGTDGVFYEINTVTGLATPIGPLLNAVKLSGISVRPSGGATVCDILTVDITPFVSPSQPFGGTSFGFDNTMGMALQAVDTGGLFNVTEVTPAAFRALTTTDLEAFDAIVINNHPGRIDDASTLGIGTTWQSVIGINSGGRVMLNSHDAPRFHMIVDPIACGGPCPPLFTGSEPFGADDLVRQAAQWVCGGKKTGLLIFNDSPGFVGGTGWDNPALNLPAAWGISDSPQAFGIGDGGYTDILPAFTAHPVYAGLNDVRAGGPTTISSFAANIGDGSFDSIFGTFDATIFTPTEVMINSGVFDVGGICPFCTLTAPPGPDGLAISLIRDEDVKQDLNWDGWFISFHLPLDEMKTGVQDEPLALYYCDASVVDITPTTLPACDGHPVEEYVVNLDPCCLVHANVDPRTGSIPATKDAFFEEKCAEYLIDIQAVVGHAFVQDPDTLECIEVDTGKSLSGPFWGWHTAPFERNKTAAVTTFVKMGPGMCVGGPLPGLPCVTSGECSGGVCAPDWLYGPWFDVVPDCSTPNMAFELLTTTPGGLPDENDNGIPDQCECCVSTTPNVVEIPDTVGGNPLKLIDTNRTLIIQLKDDACAAGQAIRVTFTNLAPPFHIWNGQQLWVTEPKLVSENGSSVAPIPGFTNRYWASLECTATPHCRTDWSSLGDLHLFHEGIIPGSQYEIQVVDCDCTGDASAYSAPLALPTARYGDVVRDCSKIPCSPPEGVINIIDINQIVKCFVSDPNAPRKARCEMEPNCPDLLINITDVLQGVNAFNGLPYPFVPKAPDACGSPCPNPLDLLP